MYLSREILEAVERRFGTPVEAAAAADFAGPEYRLLEQCARKDRAHDVTLFIRGGDGRFAVIRKPVYPPEVFRPPSGGIEPGEAFETGALREAREETGLEVRLERYLLRVAARFHCGGKTARWTTHVLLASAVDGCLDPLDRREIAEARWAGADEIMDRYRPAMLRIGSAGMRYRVELQDLGLELLGLAQVPAGDPPRLIFPVETGVFGGRAR